MPGVQIAALQAVILAERLLHRMQRTVRLGQSLDGGDVGALELPGEHRAGLHRLAVDVNDAGAALRGVAPHMGTREPQILAQELHQQGAGIDVPGDGFAVHRHCDGGHAFLLKLGPKGLILAPTGRTDGGSERIRGDFAPGRGLEQVNSEPRGQERSRVLLDAAWGMGRHWAATTLNRSKKSSAVFLAALLISRWPSWASLPPICASTL